MVTPSFSEKSKKPLLYGLLMGTVALVVLALPAGFAHAGFFSDILQSISSPYIQTTSAHTSAFNSQTLRILEPAVNIDPNPSKGGGDITIVEGTALFPESGPSGTSADIAERPTSSTISVYVVRKGDTLSEIAAMFDVSKETIIWANDIQRGIIHEGQTLIILPITGVRHTVVKGDTIASIAKKYKADAGEIYDYNGIAEGAKLAVGDVVIIPDGEVPQVVTPKKATATSPYRGGGGTDLGGFFIWPVSGGIKTQGLHGYNGIDIGAPTGTTVYAAASGVVIISRGGGWNGGYGNYVVIAHDNGVQTLYSHMSRVTATAGTRVGQGDVIGFIGRTGKATGSHLHFEVRGAKNPF